MRIETVQLENKPKLIHDYRNQVQEIMEFFDYKYSDYENRLKELKTRTYQRQSLVEVLTKLNKSWGASETTLQNIERLKDEESVVVIGGQQAGLLTGPLYSVNKVISIIQLAKQQEEKLGIPVIPVFWIAGEDHDFEEINHVYMKRASKMKKYKVRQQVLNKCPVSQVELDKQDVSDLVNTVVKQLSETKYTKEIKDYLDECLDNSSTYVDFFARLILRLFNDEGLVLMDSGNDSIRSLECDYFLEMIQKQEEISTGVFEYFKELTAKGYSISLDVTNQNGNLFYHKDNERILLSRNQKGNWIGKQNEVVLTTEELCEIAKSSPEKLSNNVITRPIMQDLVFPTLAFVGGPGEISYWSVLKPAFHALGIKMPPVVPRLSFTYVDRKNEKVLAKYQIQVDSALNGKITSKRDAWFKGKINPSIEETATEIKAVIMEAHKPLREIAKDIRADIHDLAKKNLTHLLREVEFLENRMIRAIEERYEKELMEFSSLENSLYPGGLQERIWNPLPFINEYGIDFFHKVTSLQFSFENEHFVVYV